MVAIAAAGLLSVSACSETERPGDSPGMDVSVDADTESAPDMSDEDAADGSGDTWSWPDVREEVERGPEEWTQLEGFYGGRIIAEIDDHIIAEGHGENVFFVDDAGTWKPVSNFSLSSHVSGEFDRVTYAETDDHRYLLGDLDSDWEMDLFESPRGSTEFEELQLPKVDHPVTAYTANNQLIFLSRGDSGRYGGVLHRRTDAGTWEDVTPRDNSESNITSDVTAKADVLIAETFGNQQSPLKASADSGQNWTGLGDKLQSFERHNAWTSLGNTLYSRVTYDSPAEGGADPAIVELNESLELRPLGLSSDSLSNIQEGGLFTLDGSLYGIGRRGSISKIDVEQREVDVVMTGNFPWSVSVRPAGLYTAGDTLYLQYGLGGTNSGVLSWTPGQDGWSFARIDETSAYRLYANQGQLWGYTGTMRTWHSSSSTWTSANEATPFDVTKYLMAAGPAMFRRNQPDSELEIWWRSRGWRATGRFETPESDDASDPSPPRFGYLQDAGVFEEGFVLGFTPVSEFFGGSGHDSDEDPEESESYGGGLYQWNPADNEIFRYKYNAEPDGDRPGIRSVAAHNGDLWVAAVPWSNPAGEDASTVYRIEDGRWSHISTDGLNQRVRSLQSHDGALYASVSDAPRAAGSFARWSNAEQQFHPLSMPADEGVGFRKLTSEGPLAVTPSGYFLHDAESEAWQQIAAPIPGIVSGVTSAAVDRGTLNVSLTAGGVWSIGISQ
jgi:hypothetical protein